MAVFPASVTYAFSAKANFTTTIDVTHVTGLEDEIKALAATLGINPHTSNLTSVTGTVQYRLRIIETTATAHLAAVDQHPKLNFLSSGTGVTPVIITGFSGQTADVFQIFASGGVTNLFRVSAAGTATGTNFLQTATTPTAPVAIAPDNVAGASAGGAQTLAHSDHRHAVTTAAPGDVGNAAVAVGTANTLARSDHLHTGGIGRTALTSNNFPSAPYVGQTVFLSGGGGTEGTLRGLYVYDGTSWVWQNGSGPSPYYVSVNTNATQTFAANSTTIIQFNITNVDRGLNKYGASAAWFGAFTYNISPLLGTAPGAVPVGRPVTSAARYRVSGNVTVQPLATGSINMGVELANSGVAVRQSTTYAQSYTAGQGTIGIPFVFDVLATAAQALTLRFVNLSTSVTASLSTGTALTWAEYDLIGY